MKKLLVIGALFASTIGTASAALTYNALTYNALTYNALTYNGIATNRLAFNRLAFNRLALNGIGADDNARALQTAAEIADRPLAKKKR